jgi:hypothetical protein
MWRGYAPTASIISWRKSNIKRILSKMLSGLGTPCEWAEGSIAAFARTSTFRGGSSEAVRTVAEKLQDVQVPENLQLLADLRTHVVIFRVHFPQLFFEFVNFV